MLYYVTFTLEKQIWRLSIKLKTDSYLWKPNTRFPSWCLGCSLAMVTLCLDSSSHTQHRGLHQVPGGGSADPGSRGWLLDDATSDTRTLCHAIQAEKLGLHGEKISVPPSHIWLPNSLHYNPLDCYVCGCDWMKEHQNYVQHQRRTEGKDNDSIHQLSERLVGDSEVMWRLWLKPMEISGNKFYLKYFKTFSCNFGKYIW